MTVGEAPAPTTGPLALWVNGRERDPTALHLSALDRGFTLADGLFETMRAYRGTIFRLEQHLDRLTAGARSLSIDLPSWLPDTVRAAVRAATEAERSGGAVGGDISVRLTVSRGICPPGVAPPADTSPTIVVTVHRLPQFPHTLYTHGLRACIASGRRNEHAPTAGIKTLAYTDSVLALLEARRRGADDAILCDTAGHVSEATSSNVFAYVARALVTPHAGCGALPGITRAVVLELAGELGIPAEERPVSPHELLDADEVFLTSSVRELVPLASIDGQPVGARTPGRITRQLIQAYAARVAAECGR